MINQDLVSFFYVLLISVLCGFILGFEREIHRKTAGLKTVTLVVLGSAIFTFVSMEGFKNSDDSRVAAQIVSGIGFLGAGAILRNELKIIGLTTAATLWIAAAIGILIGTGLMIHALLASIITFILINSLRIIENKISYKYLDFNITLYLQNENDIIFIKNLINDFQINLKKIEINKTDSQIVCKLKINSDFYSLFEGFIKEIEKKNIKYTL